MRVVITPANPPQLVVPAAPGAARPASYPTTTQLSAVVFYLDNTSNSSVTWTSDKPLIATVSQTGLVTVGAAGSGTGPWTVTIRASSISSNLVSTTRAIVVKALGDIDLTVE